MNCIPLLDASVTAGAIVVDVVLDDEDVVVSVDFVGEVETSV